MTNFTPKKRKEFLAALADGEDVVDAVQKIGMTKQALYWRRHKDGVFAADWAKALEQGDQIKLAEMEKEADRRAIKGNLRAVHYKGERIDVVREYSDILLMFRMKKMNPAYRETPTVDVKQDIHLHGPPGARMSSDDAEALEAATPEMRRQLLHLVKGKAG